MPTSRRRPYGSSSGVSSRCGSSSNSCTAATAVDGRSWWPGQKRSVTHDRREARRSLPARMFSSTLTSSNSSSDWNERRSPSRARWVAFSRSRRRSSRRIDPRVAGTKPVTASIRVVLPAPLGPIRPTTSPGLTSMVTSSTATHRAEADREALDRPAWRPAPARPRPAEAAAAASAEPRGGAAPTADGRGRRDVGDAVLVDDEDHEHDERAEDEVPPVLEADPVLHDPGADAADGVDGAEGGAERRSRGRRSRRCRGC